MADKPDSGDIKITVSFLKDFQSGVLQKMVTELEASKDLAELQLAANNPTGKRRLLAGAETWEPAKLLMEKYEGKGTGTAPTLWTQVDVIQKRLVQLNENISEVLRIAASGEDENIKLSTELNMSQLGEILGAGPPPPTGNGGNGGTGV